VFSWSYAASFYSTSTPFEYVLTGVSRVRRPKILGKWTSKQPRARQSCRPPSHDLEETDKSNYQYSNARHPRRPNPSSSGPPSPTPNSSSATSFLHTGHSRDRASQRKAQSLQGTCERRCEFARERGIEMAAVAQVHRHLAKLSVLHASFRFCTRIGRVAPNFSHCGINRWVGDRPANKCNPPPSENLKSLARPIIDYPKLRMPVIGAGRKLTGSQFATLESSINISPPAEKIQ